MKLNFSDKKENPLAIKIRKNVDYNFKTLLWEYLLFIKYDIDHISVQELNDAAEELLNRSTTDFYMWVS